MVDDIQVISEAETFVKKHCKLIDAEIEEERKELNYDAGNIEIGALEKKGVLINDLELHNIHSEFGTCIVEFERSSPKRESGPIGISNGDIASIWYHDEEANNKKTCLATGTVMRVGGTIQISFDNSDPFNWDQEKKYFLLKTISEVTYRRMKTGLKNILSYRYGRCSSLINILFGNAELQKNALHHDLLDSNGDLKFYNERLNSGQRDAVRFCLEQKDFAVVHGPPGTGKTTVLIEVILQLVQLGQKILVCAPSNIAIDTMVEKLGPTKSKIIRIGKTARMLESSKFFSLGAAMSGCEKASILKVVREELEKQKVKLQTAGRNSKKYVLKEVKDLQKEFYSRQYKLLQELLKNANVVLTTLTSASDEGDLRNVPVDHFDVVIIDECSQAIEAACWIVIPRAPKLIIAGDHLQLPPTIKSKEANEHGLGVSLMERAIGKIGRDCYKLLVHQFRMNSSIMQWVNSFYENKLIADDSVAKHVLNDLPGVNSIEETENPLFLVDTAGYGQPEKSYQGSKCNESEADIIAVFVKHLVDAGVRECDISVITPYSLQVTCVRLKLNIYPQVEVRTVDGFQGREKEAIIISLVRSNKEKELGFVTDKRRLNVAVSRAKAFLAVIGDSTTVGRDDTIKGLWKYMAEKGVSYSAHEFSREIDALNLPVFSPPPEAVSAKQISKPVDEKEKKSKRSKNKKKSIDGDVKKIPESESHKKIKKDDTIVEDLQSKFKGLVISSPKKVKKSPKKNLPKPNVSPSLLSLESSGSDRKRNTSTDSEVEITEVEEDKKVKQKAKQTKVLRKKKVVNNRNTVDSDEESDEDLRAIEESKLRNTTCFMKGCKAYIKLFPQICHHCKETYCIAHTLPEVHGCGDAAKRVSRHNFQRNQPPKTGDREKKIASMKLKKKVAQLASERMRKAK